nr:HEAT repeat domain-containing protein [Gemmatimonadaceae bacterium]
ELGKLLSILQRVRKASPDEDDLLTMLWEGDFVYLRYRYVDVSVETAAPLADGGEMTAVGTVDTHAEYEDEQESAQPRAGVVSMADFDGTLYFLDEKEIEYLQEEIQREYAHDLRTNVISVLLDIYEQQADTEVRNEVAEVLDNLMVHMLSAGQFLNVAFLVRESLVAAARATDLAPEQRDRMLDLPARLSAPEPLSQLLQSLDETPDAAPPADLLELFEQLRPTALGTVFEWIGRLQNVKLRPLLEEAAGRLASQNTAELVKLVSSSVPGVSLEAVRRAGALKTPAAVAPISKLLTDGSVELRVASLQALVEIGSPTALQALERSVEDEDREVRVAAVRALQSRAYKPVVGRLESMVKGKAIREADLTEKMAVFEAYGSLCGETGIAALDGMLNGKSLFGRREDSEIRACSAVALGRIGTPNALESLRRSQNEKDVVVRNAVGRALKGGTS